MPKDKRRKDPIQSARRRLAKAQMDMYAAQAQRTAAVAQGEREVQEAYARAERRVRKATLRLERRATEVAQAEARLQEVQAADDHRSAE